MADEGTHMTTELDTFYEMVEDIGIAMMTTSRQQT